MPNKHDVTQVTNCCPCGAQRRCVPVYDGKYRNTPRCSLCGELLADGVLKLPNYCGECGAKVVGE